MIDNAEGRELLTPENREECLQRIDHEIAVFDCEVAYIGSANLTGTGIGMKSDGKRNFEAGILTDDLTLVDAAADHFHSVWSGEYCKSCKRKAFCTDRIK